MKVVAKITSKFGNIKTYREVAIERVSSYVVESNLDSDADSWSIDIADPRAELIDLLRRDSEVRVTLVGGSSKQGVVQLKSGFADLIGITHENSLSLQGRDVSSVAVDSIAPPTIWHVADAKQIVLKQGRELGIPSFRLESGRPFKSIFTDGSESYWEFWYRMYRKRRMWLFTESDGTLVGDVLNYTQDPVYNFGVPTKGVAAKWWLPVQSIEIRKNAQSRVGEVWVVGNTGTQEFTAKVKDPSIRDWIKKPRKIIQEQAVATLQDAKKAAQEEIFESKVGSIEITVSVKDPGFIINQNNVAYVNFPTLDFEGEYFVVGTRLIGGPDGFQQEIRLREKQFAVTNRVPKDPEPTTRTPGTTTGIELLLPRAELADIFIRAAREFHGVFKFQTFLGVLLAICEQETNFRNLRRDGHIEWYKKPVATTLRHNLVDLKREYDKWYNLFANEGAFSDFAVGYMQLLSTSYKKFADDRGGIAPTDDGAVGGRWTAEGNIMGGGFALNDKARGLGGRDSEIWTAVAHYGEGTQYANEVKERYERKWRQQVDAAIAAGQPSAKDSIVFIPDRQLRAAVLNNPKIVFAHTCQRNDIRNARVDAIVVRGIKAFADKGFPTTITALRCDHDTKTREGRASDHGFGRAFDVGGWNESNATYPMHYLLTNRLQLGFTQLIGPIESLCWPLNYFDEETLNDHKNHIHVGYGHSGST